MPTARRPRRTENQPGTAPRRRQNGHARRASNAGTRNAATSEQAQITDIFGISPKTHQKPRTREAAARSDGRTTAKPSATNGLASTAGKREDGTACEFDSIEYILLERITAQC